MKWTLVDEDPASGLPNTSIIRDTRPHITRAAALTALSTLLLGAYLHHRALLPLSPDVIRCLAITICAPIYWNVASRLEYRKRIISTPLGGSREAGLHVFALSILLISSSREGSFLSAVYSDSRDLPLTAPADTLGLVLLAAGTIIAAAGFVQLGVRGTYMGEAFGYMCPALLTTFPFSMVDDPMYLGSSLLHWGSALRAHSLTGCYLSLVVSVTYAIAAVVFENPFTHARYALHTKKKQLSEKAQ